MLTPRPITRRILMMSASAALVAKAKPAAAYTSKQRVDRAWEGASVDRPPFSVWHHFGLEKEGPEKHAAATIDFHRQFHTDLVKVMSDFPYPQAAGEWTRSPVLNNPFPAQLRALDLIRQGVGADAYFVETLFNPWTVAEKLSSPAAVQQLKQEHPQVLLDTLEVIAKSEANHARRAVAAGAAGIFLAIANAQPPVLSRAEYAQFSEPFDRLVLDAVKSAPLNTLHLHGDKVYLEHFTAPWPARAINYSVVGTGTPLATFRQQYQGVLLGGLDERRYRSLTSDQLRQQWQQAQREAGPRFVLTPGCSVPNETTAEELQRLRQVLAA